jgi:hypothetical protein
MTKPTTALAALLPLLDDLSKQVGSGDHNWGNWMQREDIVRKLWLAASSVHYKFITIRPELEAALAATSEPSAPVFHSDPAEKLTDGAADEFIETMRPAATEGERCECGHPENHHASFPTKRNGTPWIPGCTSCAEDDGDWSQGARHKFQPPANKSAEEVADASVRLDALCACGDALIDHGKTSGCWIDQCGCKQFQPAEQTDGGGA